MKRDPRFHGLSSEHHHALVLARSIGTADAWSHDEGVRLGERFDVEIDPHFLVEEELLLPALTSTGSVALVHRTQADHDFLRAQLALARAGDGGAARAFGERLTEHVRFEERELFPTCEALLPDEVLDELARRMRGET